METGNYGLSSKNASLRGSCEHGLSRLPRYKAMVPCTKAHLHSTGDCLCAQSCSYFACSSDLPCCLEQGITEATAQTEGAGIRAKLANTVLDNIVFLGLFDRSFNITRQVGKCARAVTTGGLLPSKKRTVTNTVSFLTNCWPSRWPGAPPGAGQAHPGASEHKSAALPSATCSGKSAAAELQCCQQRLV